MNIPTATNTTPLIDAFNSSGLPFQQWCSGRLKSEPWGWPVVKEEYPVSVGDHETRIDFVAEHANNILIVECKSVNTQYKTWVFPHARHETISQTFFYNVEKPKHDPDTRLDASEIRFKQAPPLSYLANYQSIHAVELKSKSRTKFDPAYNMDTIQDAGFQVGLGLFGAMKEKIKELFDKKIAGSFRFIPVIITNAELRHCTYEPDSDGMKEDNTQKCMGIVYHYGVSDSIWQPMTHFFNGQDPNKRLSIFVVSAANLNWFFDYLNEYFT
jgi:hypothetical protein